MNINKFKKTIWQFKNYPKDALFLSIFLMCSSLFILYLMTYITISIIIQIFSIGMFIGILIIIVWIIIITIVFAPLSVSIFNKNLYDIKFSSTDLYVKRGLLVRTKRYTLSTLSRIEIILGNRYIEYYSRNSNIKMLFKLTNLNDEKKKTYFFQKHFGFKQKNMSDSGQAEFMLTSLMENFENHIKSLKNLFPNLTDIKNEEIHVSPFSGDITSNAKCFIWITIYIVIIILIILFPLVI